MGPARGRSQAARGLRQGLADPPQAGGTLRMGLPGVLNLPHQPADATLAAVRLGLVAIRSRLARHAGSAGRSPWPARDGAPAGPDGQPPALDRLVQPVEPIGALRSI